MDTDTDCIICFEDHSPMQCPDRTPKHCSGCHYVIKHLTDHSTVCNNKQWSFQPYKNLYVSPPLERFMVSCNSPVRFLYDGDWRKAFDGSELYSPETGAIVRFTNEKDFSCLTRKFAPVRIAVVVKEQSRFMVKLMILTSRDRYLVAVNLNEPFDRHAVKANFQWKTTLILAIQSTNLCVTMLTTPLRKSVGRHELRYDESDEKFFIPDELVDKAKRRCDYVRRPVAVKMIAKISWL